MARHNKKRNWMNSEGYFDTTFSRKPERSKFNKSHKHITSWNVGELIPIYTDEMLPGDHVILDLNAVIRQTTMIKPVLDELILDTFAFGIPWRILWDNFVKFMGENEDEWAVTENLTIPQTRAPKEEGWNVDSIAYRMGAAAKVPGGEPNAPEEEGFTVSSIWFRAYVKVVIDYFRDQNFQKAPFLYKGDNETQGSNSDEWITGLLEGGKPFIANKIADYFNKAKPDTQKGATPTLNLGGQAAVVTGDDNLQIPNSGQKALRWAGTTSSTTQGYDVIGLQNSSQANGAKDTLEIIKAESGASGTKIWPKNLYADLSEATGITVTQIRNAVAIQQYLELDAIGGTRYIEFLENHFGVSNGDARLQRAEYLGGNTQTLNVQQVAQTSDSTSSSPQANLAGYGLSGLNDNGVINKVFTEHSMLLVLAVVRYKNTYQQGTVRGMLKKTKWDLFDPIFNGVSMQPIYNAEIYTQGNAEDRKIWGFTEYAQDYKYKPNMVTGDMSSVSSVPLDAWHYADYYTQLPKLSSEWLQVDLKNVDRTLALKAGEGTPQLFGQFNINCLMERPMPLYNKPGLSRL